MSIIYHLRSLIASAGETRARDDQRDFQIGNGSDIFSHSFHCANNINPHLDFLNLTQRRIKPYSTPDIMDLRSIVSLSDFVLGFLQIIWTFPFLSVQIWFVAYMIALLIYAFDISPSCLKMIAVNDLGKSLVRPPDPPDFSIWFISNSKICNSAQSSFFKSSLLMLFMDCFLVATLAQRLPNLMLAIVSLCISESLVLAAITTEVKHFPPSDCFNNIVKTESRYGIKALP